MKIGLEQTLGVCYKWKIVRGSLLVAAVVLLILGVVQNGHKDVRNKAIRICYECIGIG